MAKKRPAKRAEADPIRATKEYDDPKTCPHVRKLGDYCLSCETKVGGK